MAKPKRAKPIYIGGWFTAQQQARLKALAALRGDSVNGTLCALIDNAAAAVMSGDNADSNNSPAE